MPSVMDTPVETQSTNQDSQDGATDLLSQVFGPDGGDVQSLRDQAAGEDEDLFDDQAGGDKGEKPQPEDSKPLVEVDVNGKKLKVSPDVAEELARRERDYKALQAEYTRDRQGKNGKTGKSADGADGEVEEEGAKGPTAADYDAHYRKLIIEQDDMKGFTGTMLRLIDARAETLAEQAVAKFMTDHFTPLVSTLEGVVGDQVLEAQVSQMLPDLAQYGVAVDDAQAVAVEVKRIAKLDGVKSPGYEQFLKAAMVVAGRGKRKARENAETDDEPLAATGGFANLRPRNPAPNGARMTAGTAQSTKDRSSRVVHRSRDDLDGL